MFASRGGFLAQPTAAPGGFGNNAYFPNNTAQFLSVPSSENLINWKLTTGFTIEYWIYMQSYPGTINPGPGNQDAGGTNYWSFGPAESGRLEFYFWAPGTNFVRTNTGLMNLNTWYNVCAVCTSTSGTNTTMTLYIDGVRQQVSLNNGAYANTATLTNSIQRSTGTPFRIGRYSGNRWNAYVDNLRVSNTARYSGASYTLATAPFTVDAQTQLYLTMDGTNGQTTFTDSSTFNRAVTNNSNIVTVSNQRSNHS